MIRALAALALLTASSLPAATPASKSGATLNSTAPWWEKVTVTITGDGQPQSCLYETSLRPDSTKSCEVTGGSSPGGLGASAASAREEYTRLTFERRFHPGVSAAADGLQPGDTLLGRQVMALAIDAAGAVKGCKIVAASGDVTPDYGCDAAAAEHFEASAGKAGGEARQGFMTILVYGHSEHLV